MTGCEYSDECSRVVAERNAAIARAETAERALAAAEYELADAGHEEWESILGGVMAGLAEHGIDMQNDLPWANDPDTEWGLRVGQTVGAAIVDLRAKLATASYELAHANAELAAARKFDTLKKLSDRAIAAEADNAALVAALEWACNTLHETVESKVFDDGALREAFDIARHALASPHPGAALLEAVRFIVSEFDAYYLGHRPVARLGKAIDALRPFVGKP